MLYTEEFANVFLEKQIYLYLHIFTTELVYIKYLYVRDCRHFKIHINSVNFKRTATSFTYFIIKIPFILSFTSLQTLRFKFPCVFEMQIIEIKVFCIQTFNLL